MKNLEGKVLKTSISIITFKKNCVEIMDKRDSLVSFNFKIGTPVYYILTHLSNDIEDEESMLALERISSILLTVPMMISNIKFFKAYMDILDKFINDPTLFVEPESLDDETEEKILEDLKTQDDAIRKIQSED